jgi:dTDP-glucose 4,6-dehydratase
MNVLVTGGAGFIGHHVIEYLLDNTDWNVVSLDRLDFSGNLNRLNDIMRDRTDKSRVRSVFHDLKAPINEQVSKMIGNIDIVLHLAAASHVTRSIVNPMEFVESNVIGTVNLLEYARTLPNLTRFVYFSTDEVFGPAIDNYTHFTEYDRYNATNPYSASKAAAEEMCVAFENTYKIPLYITHTMNVYGERQATEKYIPLCLKKMLNNERLTIHYDSVTGNIGGRSYLYAKDVASALLFILGLKEVKPEQPHTGGKCMKFNIAATESLNNLDVANLISQGSGVPLEYDLVDPNILRPGHDFKYLISGDYLRSLGWSEKYDVLDNIPRVAKWYMDNPIWLK